MTVKEVSENLNIELVAGEAGVNSPVTGCHIGDLLSMVMSHAKCGDAWITIQGNINVPAVASLTEIAMVIIAEGQIPDKNTEDRCNIEGIPLYKSDKSAFELACMVEKCL